MTTAEPRGHSRAVATLAIVNFNSGDGLGNCLDSLSEHPSTAIESVVVIDNASSDASAAACEKPRTGLDVRLIANETNVGLAAAVNQVLDDIDTRWLAVLNPDTAIRSNWVDLLVDALAEYPAAAAASPLITMSHDGRINSLGQRLHVTGLGFNRLLGHARGDAPTDIHEVDGLHGAAFVVDTEALVSIGGWDTTGFLYHEDVALSWSLRACGSKILAVPDAWVEHDYTLSMNPEKLFLLERGRAMLVRTHLSLSTRMALSPFLAISHIMVYGMCVLRGRDFVVAKRRAGRWVRDHPDEVSRWRTRVEGFRAVSDRALLRGLAWGYPIRQIIGVGTEKRGTERRSLKAEAGTER